MTRESMAAAAAEVAVRLSQARRAVVLTGAGISAESGIPTFRSGTNALWRDQRPEDLATPEAFSRDPALVTDWYLMRLRMVLAALPNPGHAALAEVERCFVERGAFFSVITQNVDGLHQAGGSSCVVELHGSIRIWRCVACGRERQLTSDFVLSGSEHGGPISCDCGALLRPGVVWFGEVLPAHAWAAADAAASHADVFIVAGTSAAVYPAAGLIAIAKRAGAFIVEVNPEATEATALCDLAVRARSGEFLPLIV